MRTCLRKRHSCLRNCTSPATRDRNSCRMSSLVKAHEFFGQMQREDCTFRLLNSNIGADDTVLRGTFSKTTVRSGLTVHYSDVTNLCDLHTEAESAPHLGVKLFFQGGVSASIGDQDIPMPHRAENSDRWIPSATLFHQQERELFRRRAAVGDRVRKLTIKIFPEWLESGDVFADASAQGLKRFTATRLAARSWSPSASLVALATQAIKPSGFEPYLARLYMESRTLGIVAEAFSLLAGTPPPAHSARLSAAENKRLRRAEELLNNSRVAPSVEELATEIGVSVNTLQRLFHTAHRTTVFHYIRKLKLEQARTALENEGVTIAQAAYLAGYTSPANFATAFKRQHGFSPRDARSR
ncbi:transcriptional regulator [Rhizobium rhizogenes]|uniref:Transcriptional regulator protein n=2 Tax=Rhizobium rhizogenes TaxID=359 RepID=B9JK45_RHIR8|nr:transcriptional regulator protein [Rhizobium rhizogenes K84]KEA08982.1 transcriptional regulator [Rhizobium rhizogenes]OCJ10516.1 transcriptional regulator [Agrobacterium sp. B131/95]OCJ15359.1 transcriptional regulator [Agrobacterium sp. B133/95]